MHWKTYYLKLFVNQKQLLLLSLIVWQYKLWYFLPFLIKRIFARLIMIWFNQKSYFLFYQILDKKKIFLENLNILLIFYIYYEENGMQYFLFFFFKFDVFFDNSQNFFFYASLILLILFCFFQIIQAKFSCLDIFIDNSILIHPFSFKKE